MKRADGCMVLVPYDPQEAITLKEAAALAGKTPSTIKNWCEAFALGRRVGGTWSVSRVALSMFLDGDERALRLYLNGDRTAEEVLPYFQRFNLPIVSVSDRVSQSRSGRRSDSVDKH